MKVTVTEWAERIGCLTQLRGDRVSLENWFLPTIELFCVSFHWCDVFVVRVPANEKEFEFYWLNLN